MNLPNDLTSEQGAIGCALQDPALWSELKAELFLDLRHQAILDAVQVLDFGGDPLSFESIYLEIRRCGDLEKVGGAGYLAGLPDFAPSTAQFPVFLASLRDFAARRRMLRDAEDLTRRASDLSQPVDPTVKRTLPELQDVSAFTTTPLPEPPQLIRGVLHRGCKLAIGGGSKTFKSWTLIDLALAISHGCPWLSFHTERSRVAYVNLELPDWSLHSRIRAVAQDRAIVLEPGWLHVWNLRGFTTNAGTMFPIFAAELRKHELGLLIVDPIYKLYGSTDENSARDIANLLNQFETLARETGAAIAFAAHFSKGNQAGKESVDRISGSGVFARDPDAILTFTRHEADGAFVVDSTLRNCKAVEPFVVRWEYPLMRRDGELDPKKLKQAKGRPSPYKAEQLLEHLSDKGLPTTKWQEIVCQETGMSRAKFFDFKNALESIKVIKKDDKGKWIRQCSQGPKSPKSIS